MSQHIAFRRGDRVRLARTGQVVTVAKIIVSQFDTAVVCDDGNPLCGRVLCAPGDLVPIASTDFRPGDQVRSIRFGRRGVVLPDAGDGFVRVRATGFGLPLVYSPADLEFDTAEPGADQ